MTDYMSLDEFKDKTASGQLFSVDFIKRGTGELRTMTARRGVKKGVKGVGMSYNPEEHDLLIVYDMQKLDPASPHNAGKSQEEMQRGAFRSIDLTALVALRMEGQTWAWNSARQRFETQ